MVTRASAAVHRLISPQLIPSIYHPFIERELAYGNRANHAEILMLLQALPSTPNVEPDEILYFIDKNSLMGPGLGYVDVHLLASSYHYIILII